MITFLDGSGEMASRMRAFDWSTTSLGPPENWPAGLRTAVRLLLNSHHPMHIFWGAEAIFFYNDGFVPSAGLERHPSALGRPAAESWGEIWPVIGTEVDRVRSGGGHTWYEDQHVPILRNGCLEDAYWTYGFSPIDDDTAPNGIGGVISILTETTRRKELEGSLQGLNLTLKAEGDRLHEMFEQAPSFMAVLREPDHRFELTNDAYRRLIGGRDVVGLTVREALTDVDGQPFFDLLDRVYATGEPFVGRGMEIWLERTPGAPSERRILDFIYQPIRDRAGVVTGIFVEGNDVTEMKVATDELREREQRLSLIVGAATDYAILTLDGDRTVTSWSAGAAEIFGYAEDEIVGRGVDTLFTPEDREAGQPARELAGARADGRSPDVRWHLRKDGGRVFLNGSMRTLRDAAGQELGFLKIARDETELRRAEEALRQGEERFRTILDTVQAAFAIVQVKFDADDVPVDYLFVEANPAFEREAGVNLRGKWVTEFAPDLERFWFETYGRVAKTRVPENFENYAKAFGRWFDVRAVPVGNAADLQIALIFNDVTERRDAEERLRASEALARENAERVQLALAAGAIIGTWHWDLPSDRFTIDEAFARSFGVDPALGREGIPLARIVETVHPDDQAGLAKAIEEVIQRGGAYAHQYRTRRADGNYYWLEANGRVEHAPDGTPLTFPGVLLDVDGRRAVEAERDRAAAELRALNETLEQRVSERTAELMTAEEALRQSQKMEAVGQLTGGVAHDFNNLLTIIRSSVDFLRRPELPDARKQRYLDAVSDTVDRAAKLTGQLLAFARRQALKPEVFDVGTRVRGVSDMLDTVTGARIQVTTVVPECPCFIRADLSQFETALVNMAVNARDAMDGVGKLTLRLSCNVPMPPIRGHAGSQSRFAAVSVTDEGTGIAPDQLSKIFEPFFTTKEVGKGTGLGLSQVFGFAKQSGGDVDVESEIGVGTTFTLYLPEVEVEPSDAPKVDPNQLLAPVGAGQHVLVVEDNIEVGRFCTQILDDLGYVTALASNAEEALEMIGSDGGGFDAVFSDVVMPGMGGVAFARALRDRLPELPVVLASGYSHVLASGDDHGFELLHKPYSAEQLARVLRRVTAKPVMPLPQEANA
ncbi:PAS domain S-box protein [Methylobacterium sp. J-068]|uniref:PAS domain-containing hybrid sensor histidine kinase/response regulator n=1 Tax=Methylobacterium sp. J-068 TaxID=2836649 RepID=UPI001FB97F51|nr:PAS domain S-box protein [Methylobacterium sp. J-068]MCJ2035578.1 PAS domain S-box protein [Methylobacterium sp. J-068]